MEHLLVLRVIKLFTDLNCFITPQGIGWRQCILRPTRPLVAEIGRRAGLRGLCHERAYRFKSCRADQLKNESYV